MKVPRSEIRKLLNMSSFDRSHGPFEKVMNNIRDDLLEQPEGREGKFKKKKRNSGLKCSANKCTCTDVVLLAAAILKLKAGKKFTTKGRIN